MSNLRRTTPVRAKATVRVDNILSCAREVFAAQGFDAATVAEIAQRAGVSEATVFTYFSSKRALCTEVIRHWYAEIIDNMDQRLAAHAGFEARLRTFVEVHLELFLTQGRGMCALVLSEGRTKGRGLDDVIQPLQKAYASRLTQLLKDGLAQGRVRGDVPLGTVRAGIFGLMEHLLWESVHAQRDLDGPLAARHAWRFLSALLSPSDQTQ